MKPLFAAFLFFPALVFADSATEKLILEELQKLTQRIEKIEKKLEDKPPAIKSPHNDPERKVFGMHLTRGPKGNRVTSVIAGGPADKSGLRPGDLVTSIDGKDVTGLPAFDLLRELETKDAFDFAVESRSGEKRQVKMAKARQGGFMDEKGRYTLLPGNLALAEVSVGQIAPEVTAKDLQGKEVKLSSLKGNVVLVNFTATWCGPCKEELPELQKVYDEQHGKGFEVISVFLDSDSSTVERHVKEHKITWPYVFDGKGWENAVAREWGISGVPTNPIIDQTGKVVKDNARGASIRSEVERYLGSGDQRERDGANTP